MSEQENRQASTVHRPTTNDREDWKAYWKQQGQSWRTEPEIDGEQQKYLAERRAIVANIENGIYPFKDIDPKLTRADIEWLLATHENGRGPVDWIDESQRKQEGLDMRGADLSHIDLSHLPLSRLRGGLDGNDWEKGTERQTTMAAVIMKDADLHGAHLEGAILRKARLEQTFLTETYLAQADLFASHLEGANLRQTHLDGTSLERAFLNVETLLSDISVGDDNQ